MGEMLQGILRQANPRKLGGMTELTDAWSRAAGPETARGTRIVALKGGVLTVSAESAALRQEIETYRKAEILARLAQEFPTRRITALKCTLGS